MTQIIRPNAGHILVPRFVDVGMPQSSVMAKGRYQLIKRDAYGTEIERTPWFDNIILDSGLNRWGTGAVIAGAAIGTGTATPVAGDAGLQTQTHYTATAGVGSGITAGTAPNYNNTRTYVYRTTLGSLNGNYSEVGVGWASGSMFSRALILDGGGSPTTISVSSVQQLDIVYQLSVYPPLVDTGPTTVTISGVSYDVTGRALAVTSTSNAFGAPSWEVTTGTLVEAAGFAPRVSNGTLAAITAGNISGTTSPATSVSVSAYSSSSYTQNAAITYELDQGNVSGGISISQMSWSMASFQYLFNPVIPKTNKKSLVLNYSVNWARR